MSPLAALYARAGGGIKLGLFGMREACERAGHPERSFECVHIAGTNGKGSTSAFVESIARKAGRRTGMYSSPHLCRFAERIRIDGEVINDGALDTALSEALGLAPELSFFEVATLAAFLAFRAAKVDFVVLEVGLGGRLDATNVVERPCVSAITSIGMDHMQYLGNTLAEIATEKAGILKPRVPCVVGRMDEIAERTIANRARVIGSPLLFTKDHEKLARAVNEAASAFPLYQRSNLEVACLITKELGWDAHFTAGALAMRWPGRFEQLDNGEGPVLLDGAHNPEGATALVQSLAARGMSPAALVFGAMGDKEWRETLGILGPTAGARVYVQPTVGARVPAPFEGLQGVLPGIAAPSVAQALATARSLAGPHGLVLVAGSLFVVGEARAALLGLPMDPPIAL